MQEVYSDEPIIGYIDYYELNDRYTEVTRDEIELLSNGVGEGMFNSTEGIKYFINVVSSMLNRLGAIAHWSNKYPIPISLNKKGSNAMAVDERSSLINLLVDLSKRVFDNWKKDSTWASRYAGFDFDDLYT